MEVREVKASRILNPTSIDLGEFVINPYKGCAFSCEYCYSRFSKSSLKDKRQWGSFVDVRLNAPLLLEKELLIHKPKSILLGSTTECFQGLENTYHLTSKILEILNSHGVYYSILTRSPLILNSIKLLNKGFCKSIYFTVNYYDDKLKTLLEPKTPSFEARFNAIETLLKENIPVIPYLSPILPFVSDISYIFERFKNVRQLDFEGLNFNLGNISKVIEAVCLSNPELKEKYQNMLENTEYYNTTWESIKKDLLETSKQLSIKSNVYIHGRNTFFTNKYN